MTPRLALALVAVLVPLAGGCFLNNVQASELFRDSLEQLNEGTRWSRFDLAYERVDPEYRAEFAKKHQRWGHGIEIADYEMLGARLAKDEQSAVSTIAVRWYRYETMTLHETIIRQRWRNTGEGFFVLAEERVTGGDALLLTPMEDEDRDEDHEDDADESVARVGAESALAHR